MDDTVTPLRRSHTQASRIAMAVAASIPIYILLVELFLKDAPAVNPILPPDRYAIARNTAIIVAVLCVFIARLVRSMLLMKSTVQYTPDSEELAHHVRNRLMTTFLVSYGLAEFPAVLGIVTFLLTGQTRPFYLLILVSVYLLVVHAPRYSQWHSWYTNRMGRMGDARR